MDRIVNFQLSLFGSFINIQPDQEITMRLMTNLLDENMVPGTANVSSVDPVNKRIETETRLQLITQDKAWKIIFFQERVDVTYDYLGGDVFYTDFDTIIEKAVQLVEKTFKTFPKTTGNRLAVNGRVILQEMNREETDKFINRFTTPIVCNKDEHLEEWNLHYNIKKVLRISKEKEETCNTIVDMGNVIGVDTKTGIVKNRMSVGLDINTVPENQEYRFEYTDLLEFVKSAKMEMKTIIDAIEEV